MVEEETVEVRQRPRLLRRLAWYRRQAESLEEQSAVDDLTGLRNQRALWRELERRAQLCSPAHPLAVVMFDFDLFREINESYGRGVGDAVLRRGASVVRGLAASPRAVFRYGGEEFVLLADADEGHASELADEVRTQIAAQNGSIPAVTVSCGVAEFDGPFEPWVALDRADAALRDAKRSGRNRVVVCGHSSPGERLALIEDLEHETARRAAMALAVATLQVRDSGTADHSDDVLTLCEAVGRRLGFDDRELEHLMAGAQLHDVGKVAVPSSILNKPGALTEDEWAVIHEHTVIGERILRSVPEMAGIATIVRHSHEHWDGKGYPDGLAGDDIPRASRVILCADAFHAMRADRPYRRGRPVHEALAELRACRGTQFDPDVVDAFIAEASAAHKERATGTVSGRHRRLVVLLTAFVIGGGSAVAGIPEVRETLKSVFGATVAPSVAESDAASPRDFGFGPLGDLLSIEQAAQPAETSAGQPGAAKTDRPQRAAQRGTRGGGVGGGRDGAQRRELHGTPGRGGHRSPPRQATPAPPASTSPEGGEAKSPQPPVTDTRGNGRALGRGVPTPRPPAQSPSHGPGGRADPPALGRWAGPNGTAKGHHK